MNDKIKNDLLKAAMVGDREAMRYLIENGIVYSEIFSETLSTPEDDNAIITIDGKDYTLEDLKYVIEKAEQYDDLCQ